jgi:hypothetical protein
MQNDIDECLRILGLNSDATMEDVERSWAFHTTVFHPDNSPREWQDLARSRFQQVKESLAQIRRALEARRKFSIAETVDLTVDVRPVTNPTQHIITDGEYLCTGKRCDNREIARGDYCVSVGFRHFHVGCE